MKKIPLILIAIFICTSLLSTKVFATHSAGADISYTCLGGNDYRVQLTFYRDCAGSGAPNGVGIRFYSVSCGIFFTDTLEQVAGTGQEISNLCPTATTSCTDPMSPNKGIQEYIYRGTITFPAQCNDWVIEWQYCCRNCDITTMVVPLPCVPGTNPGFNVQAHLNNRDFNGDCNSSPQFSNVPIIFVCLGQTFNYNHGVYDPDGDSLVYSFVDPLIDSVTPIPYITGYSATNPITSAPPVTINPSNGDILMHPTSIEVGVVAVLVDEYRDGIWIGSVVRDMEIYVQNCSDILPTATGINGGAVHDTTACPNVPFCFDIFSDDLDAGQIVSMTWNGGIGNATFSVSGTPHPTGHFCWTPTTADLSSTAHSFTVTVTDDACPNTGYQTYSYNILVNSPFFGVSTDNVHCFGNSDGLAIGYAIFGNTNYTYEWNVIPPVFNDSLEGLSQGTYSVTVTDTSTGCFATQSVTLTDPAPLGVSTSTSQSVCFNDSTGTATAIPFGGTSGYTYQWDNGDVTATADSLLPGNYTVVVTDANGCTVTDFVTVVGGTSTILISVTGVTSVACFDDASGIAIAEVSGGTPGYTYSWNTIPVQTNDTIFNLTAGTYTVTVTDTIGCVTSASVTITQPTLLTATDTSFDANCGLSDGTAVVFTSGGTPGYTYLWSSVPPQYTDTATGLPAGVYLVTVTDALGCIAQQAVAISDNTLQSTSDVVTPLLCNGDSIAIIAVSVLSGGSGSYTYSWDNGISSTGDTVINIPAGTYHATITDTITGCQNIETIVVSEPTLLTYSVSSTDVLCNGDSTGTASADNVSGGTAGYSYSWNTIPPQLTATATGLLPGTYIVTVTDANGCHLDTPVTIAQPDSISATDSTTHVTCNGASDGAIDITVSGGVASYTYLWSGGHGTAEDLTGLDAGTYTVIITDANNCSVQLTFIVNQPPAEIVNAGADTSLCDSSAYTLHGSAVPAGYIGTWTSGTSGIIFGNINDSVTTAINFATGLNTVTWTITNGTCSFSDDATIVSFFGVTAVAGGDQTNCSNTATLSAATPPTGFTGTWTSASGTTTFSNINDPNATASNIPSPRDTMFWNISNGTCSYSDTLVVNVFQPATVDAGPPMTLACGSTDTLLYGSIPPAGFTGTWTWTGGTVTNPNDPNSTVTGLPVGTSTFTWTVADSLSICSGSSSVTITVTQTVSNDAGTPMTLACGSTDTTLSGSVPPTGYTGTWTTTSGATITNINDPNSAVTNLPLGITSTFIWTIDNGICTGTDSVTITTIPDISADAGSDQSLCVATATMNAVDAPAGYTGTWTTSNHVPVFSDTTDAQANVIGIPAGTTTFYWTVTNGICTATDSLTMFIVPDNSAYAGADADVCGDTAFLNAGPPPTGFTGFWTSTNSGITFSNASNPYSTAGLLPIGTTTFIWTIDNGICQLRDTVELTGSTPITTSAGSNNGACGNTFTLNATPAPTGYTGTWTSSNGTVTISNVNDPNAVVSNLPSGVTTFYWNVTDGICSAADSVQLNASQSVSTYAGTDSSVCGTSTTLTATTTPIGYTGTWTSSSAVVTFSNVNDPNPTISNLPAGITTFTWTITNGICTASATVIITIAPTIIPTDAGADSSICGGTSIVLNATPAPAGFSGVWTASNGTAVIANPNSSSTTADQLPYSSTTFTWTISLNNCTGSDEVTVSAFETVTADAGAYVTICHPEVELNAAPGTIGSGMWVITQGNGTIANANASSTAVSNLGAGINIFLWTVSNGPCLASDTVSVYYDNACIIELPTAFSPGGTNPDYDIHGIDGYPENEFRVFNRWGNEVYFYENYTGHNWSGENKDGKPLPDGTYYVILIIKNSDIRKNTYVDIRR